jgi:hypothetical protein
MVYLLFDIKRDRHQNQRNDRRSEQESGRGLVLITIGRDRQVGFGL